MIIRKKNGSPSFDYKSIESTVEYFPVYEKIIPSRDGKSLVWCGGKHYPILLDNCIISLLPHIKGCKSFNRHAEYVFQATNGILEINRIEHILSYLFEKGLLLSKEKLLERILTIGSTDRSSPSESLEIDSIDAICWVTANNTESLTKSIQSFIDSIAPSEVIPDIFIFDDSQSNDLRLETKIYLHSLVHSNRPSPTLYYIGEEEKKSFISSFLNRVPGGSVPKEIITFAVQGLEGWDYTVGANRNTMLLATIGKTIISNDDDVFGKYTDLSFGKQNNITFTSNKDPTEITFFDGIKEIESTVTLKNDNIMSYHQSYIGQKAEDLINSRMNTIKRISLENMGVSFFKKLQSYDSSPAFPYRTRVRAVYSGVCGDSGMGPSRYILFRNGNERRQIEQSFKEYMKCIEKRSVLWGVTSPTILESPLFRATHFSLYNKEMLPPFFPVGRNEDSIFALLLNRCYSSGTIALLPISILHKPSKPRSYTRDDLYTVQLRMADIINIIILAIPEDQFVFSPDERLINIGKFIKNLGTLPLLQFEEYLYSLWLNRVKTQTSYYNYLLSIHKESPSYWAEDIFQIIDAYENYSLNNCYIVPSDFNPTKGETLDDNELCKRERCRDAVRLFGELLIWWPYIYNTVKNTQKIFFHYKKVY